MLAGLPGFVRLLCGFLNGTGARPLFLKKRVCYTKILALFYKVRNKIKDYATSEVVVLTTGVALEE
jgi:hypothetical protein